MKKVLSLVLAVAMIASMATMAFAADKIATKLNSTSYDEKATPKIRPVMNAYGPLAYDSDKKLLEPMSSVQYGKSAYYLLLEPASSTLTSAELSNHTMGELGSAKTEAISGMKAKEKWEMGSSHVDSVSIVRRRIDVIDDTDDGLDDAIGAAVKTYYSFLVVNVKNSTNTNDVDVIGTVTLNKTSGAKVKDLVLDISLNVFWTENWISNENLEITKDISGLKSEKVYAAKYDCDDEVDIEFENGAIFTVDVSGQGKNLLYTDTKYSSTVSSKYPLAELDFWNFGGTKFNRTGSLFLPATDDFMFIYELKDDGTLAEIPNAEYDEYDEGFYIRTRTLGSYVVSDMELITAPVVPDVSDVGTTTPTVPVVPTNPSTGAAA